MNRVSRIRNIKKLLVLSFLFQGLHSGNTPLMSAIQTENQLQALTLIGQMNTSDFNIQDHSGNTALMWAIQKFDPSQRPTNPRQYRHHHHHRKWEFEYFDMGRGDWGGYMPPPPPPPLPFYATALALAIINKMNQAGLNLQDNLGNTALMWTVEKNMPDTALALIPKMSFAGLQLLDNQNQSALQKMQSHPQFGQANALLRNIFHLPAIGGIAPTIILDALEKKFGDYLNPFAIPPAQEKMKSLDSITKDFTNKNLTGLDLSNHDWSNCNFSGAILNNANFSNSTVDNALFTGASLQGTNFELCDITAAQLLSAQTFVGGWFSGNNQFQHTDFTGKPLNGCSFENCNLTGTIFDGALLQGTDFTGANLTLASFKECHFDTFTLFESAIIDQANFTKSTLTSDHVKQSLSHKNTNFSGCDFSQQNLMGIDFSNCDLTDTNLTGADCSFCNFSRAVISAKQLSPTSNLAHANLSYLSLNGLQYPKKSLRGATIRNSSLQNCDLTGAILDSISISNSDFTQSIFQKVSMSKPELLNSKFIKTDFSNATQISYADFTSCNIEGAIFDYSTPTYAQFTDRTLSDIQLFKAFGPMIAANSNPAAPNTAPNIPTLTLTTTKEHLFIWPFKTPQLTQTSSGITQNIRLTSTEWQKVAQVARAKIPGVTFYTVNFLNPQFDGSGWPDGPHGLAVLIDNTYPEETLSMIAKFGTVSNNSFSQWGQINFNLSFSEPFPMTHSDLKNYAHGNFSNQWLESISFSNCDFSYSNLSNSYLKGCDFSNANMTSVNFTLANLNTCNFTNAICSYSTMQSLLSETNFTNATVDHVSFALSTGFTGQQLMQTQKEHPYISIKGLPGFDHCDFSERNFSHGLISSMSFLFTSFENCNLSYVTFNNSNCTGATFKNANLEKAICAKGNFTQADFRGADLNNTNFSGADLRQAIFSSPDQLQNAITDKYTRLDKVLIIK